MATRRQHAVRVENIPECVNRREVVALFNSLIGEVLNSADVKDVSGSYLEITFHTADAAKRALCMSGYVLGGAALIVTASSSGIIDISIKQNCMDKRRNLYILGLAFALTKTEFSNAFSKFGTVMHCVILATVDNASRRRGFVVMSTHEEAKLAMNSLNHTQLKGNTLDISWAVVQRSQGFLDGGDRSVLPDLQPLVVCSPDNTKNDIGSVKSPDTPVSSSERDITSFLPGPTPTLTLLVTNLPDFLFSQIPDLHPLFCPFGRINELQILQSSQAGCISVVVEYQSIESAKEAKETLQGQCYANYTVNTEFVRPLSPMDLAPASTVHPGNQTNSNDVNSSTFNTFLPPFTRNTPQLHTFPGAYNTTQAIEDYCRLMSPNSQYAAGSSLHPFSLYEYRPLPSVVPRSNFANTRRNDKQCQCRSPQVQYSTENEPHNVPHSSYPTCYA